MAEYKAKTLIEGFKLGIEFAGKILVAVPLEKAIEGNLVLHGNGIMRIKGDPVKTITFPDKFGRGDYTLCYYEWINEPLWG